MSNTLDFYYPTAKSNTYYALYMQGIDRFLLIEKHNVNVLIQTSYVLSSKIPTSIFLLPEKDRYPLMNNENCMLFSFNHKKYNPSAAVVSAKPYPTVSIPLHNKIIKLKSIEASNKTEQELIEKVKQYAQFCQQVLHASTLTSMFYQFSEVYPQFNYFQNIFFSDVDSELLETKENRIKDLTQEIMYILFFSNTINEAKDNIEKHWLARVNFFPSESVDKGEKKTFANEFFIPQKISMFYKILEQPVPASLKEISEYEFK